MVEDIQHQSAPRGNQDVPPEEETSIDLIAMRRTLGRGGKMIALAALLGFALALAVAFLIAPSYTSEASFIPPSSGSSSGMAALAGQLSQISGLGAGGLLGGAKSPGDLYAGILRSRAIASELVKDFELLKVYRAKKESKAETFLADHTSVTVGPKDSIVTISVTDKSAKRAQDIANGYLRCLREMNGKLALSESSQRRAFFGEQLAKEKDALKDAEVDLKMTEEQSGLIAPAGQTASEIGMIAQTRAQIGIRQVELSALRQSATEQNSEVVRLESEIADLQGQLARLNGGKSDRSDGAIPTSKVPQLELEYVRKEREVKYHEALFEMLSRQYEAARMDEAHDAPVLQILDTASLPDTRSGPPRTLISVGGLILGGFLACCWVLLQERLRAIRESLHRDADAPTTAK